MFWYKTSLQSQLSIKSSKENGRYLCVYLMSIKTNGKWKPHSRSQLFFVRRNHKSIPAHTQRDHHGSTRTEEVAWLTQWRDHCSSAQHNIGGAVLNWGGFATAWAEPTHRNFPHLILKSVNSIQIGTNKKIYILILSFVKYFHKT